MLIALKKPSRFSSALSAQQWNRLIICQCRCVLLGILAITVSPLVSAQRRGAEVEIGSPKILEYSRVYPLLDGLFQDVAATQIQALTLNPNAPNASALDALQQIFQLQLQYSATAGIQNGLAAQQSSVASNYAAFQTVLLQQQSTLLAAQVTAQRQLGDAQLALDSLANPTAAQTAAATQQLTVAKDNLNSVTSQLADVQGTLAKSLSVSPTFNTNNIIPNPPASSPVLPIVTPATPPAPDKFSPNFPATKQMDNQITLLWERLARLVETLNQGNSQDENLYLVEFDTNIMPDKRKHQMLNIRYPLTCQTKGVESRVVDMYPRTAAVNILNEKYRETRFGLGALLSFFSVGLNASYNRDHLKISQTLSQSSYITGYGVGENTVGWLYGISLGDDSIAPGVRSVYALIAVPKGCGTPQIQRPSVEWTKDPAMTSGTRSKQNPGDDVVVKWEAKDFPQPSESSRVRCPKDGCESKIVYSPVEYDNSTTQAQVMVTVSLDPTKAALDKEEIINVNGRYLQRARDNFGRAISAAGTTASGGILETGTLSVNTWLPVSSTTFVMNLDGIAFGNKFPNILLQSPSGVIDLTNSFVHPSGFKIDSVGDASGDPKTAVYTGTIPGGDNDAFKGQIFIVDGFSAHANNNGIFMCTGSSSTSLTLLNENSIAETHAATAMLDSLQPQVIISGDRWYCTTDCGDILPPLARPKATKARIIVTRWAGRTENGGNDQLSITVSDSGSNQATATLPASGNSLQVITDDDSNVWGSNPIVQLDQGNGITPLTVGCRARGARWVCPLLQTWRNFDLTVRIVDPDHAKGSFVGEGALRSCPSNCAIPFIWNNPIPSWDAKSQAWRLVTTMANLQFGDQVTLRNDAKLSLTADPLNCDDYLQPCQIRFTITKKEFDNLTATTRLQVLGPDGKRLGPRYNLLLLSSISPKLTAISTAQDELWGTNLAFDQIKVGPDGSPVLMMCDDSASHCWLTSKYPQDKKGFLYFLTATSTVPVVLNGSQVLHDPAAIKAATQAAGAGKGTPAQAGASGPAPPPPEKKQSVPVIQPQ